MSKKIDYENLPYCPCCGRLKTDIQKELYKIDYDDRGWRGWEGHRQHKGNSYFYDAGMLCFCENCGQELSEDDVQTCEEFMGMCGDSKAYQTMLVGYKCSGCGFEEEY